MNLYDFEAYFTVYQRLDKRLLLLTVKLLYFTKKIETDLINNFYNYKDNKRQYFSKKQNKQFF